MKTTAKKPAKVEEGRIYRPKSGDSYRWMFGGGGVWLRRGILNARWIRSSYSVEQFLTLVFRGDLVPEDSNAIAPALITANLFAAYDTRSGVVYYETASESRAKALAIVKATLPGDKDVKVIPLTVTYMPPMAKGSLRNAKQEASK